jgi:hypothetical protein
MRGRRKKCLRKVEMGEGVKGEGVNVEWEKGKEWSIM